MNRVEQSRQQRRPLVLSAFILFVLLLAQGLSREALAQSQPQNQWETNGDNIHNTNPGNVGVGTTDPQASLHVSTSSSAVGSRGIIAEQTSNDGNGALLIVRKSRAGAAVQNGDFIGNLYAQGFDGANWVNSSRLRFAVDGPVSAATVPTALQFLTGSTAPGVERMRITSAGNVGIGTPNPTSKLVLSANAATPIAPLDGTVFHIVGADSLKTRVTIDSFGTTAGPSITFRHARGTGAAPSAAQAGDALGIVYGSGYGATQFLSAPKPAMWMVATENWTDTSAGSAIFFNTVQNGTASTVERMRISHNGNVGIGTAAPAHRLDVSGNVNASGLCIGGNCKTDWSQVGGSQWATSGSNIHYSAGNVGIGTDAPANRLHVVGGARLEGAGRVYVGAGAPVGARGLELVEMNATTFSIRHHDPNVAWQNIAINPYGGKLGVGTANPLGQFSVGDASVDGSSGHIVIGKRSGGGTRQFMMGFDGNFNFVIGDYGHSNIAGPWTSPLAINWQAPSNSFYINPAGNVGVGTAAPTEKLHVVGNINVTGNINAKYQDLAEWVPSTQSLAAGTVVVLDTARSNHVVASSAAYDTRVAGVVSAQPGVLLGEGGDGKLMVATTGRVKVRVDATRGPVRVGDLLVTSDREGLAMKSEPVALGGRLMHLPGTLIGKALEPLEKGVGEILVLLSLQ